MRPRRRRFVGAPCDAQLEVAALIDQVAGRETQQLIESFAYP